MSTNDPQNQPGVPASSPHWSQSSWPAPSQNVGTTIDQLQTVIEAAERAAEAIRRDAQEQARVHLAEAQRNADRLTAERVGLISELTDDLIRHVANVRDHSEQMVRALEAAISSVTHMLDHPGLAGRYPPSAPPTAPSHHGGAAFAPPPPAPPAPGFQQARVPAPPQYSQPPAPVGAQFIPTGDQPPPQPPPMPPPVPPQVIDDRLDHQAAALVPEASPPPPNEPADQIPVQGRQGEAVGWPPDSNATAGQNASSDAELVQEQAIDHAHRLADAGSDPETIASVLRQLWGVSDPTPIVERVLARR